MCDSPLPQNGGSNCIEDNSHVSIINEIGGMKEIASQTCIVENCPGTNGLELGTFGFLFLIINIRSKFYPHFNFRHIIRIGDERSNVMSRWRYNCY